MVSQTWDGKRVYFTSSLLANWDKNGEDDEQFLKAFTLGREEARAALRGRLPQGEARPAAHHAASARRTSGPAAGTPTASERRRGRGDEALARARWRSRAPRSRRASGGARGDPGHAARRRRELRFEPPPPGSYELPADRPRRPSTCCSRAAGDRAPLLDLRRRRSRARLVRLPRAAGDGVPALDRGAAAPRPRARARRRELARRVRLVTVSFDPARDTPERMARPRRRSRRRGAGSSSPARATRRSRRCSPTSARTSRGSRARRTRRAGCATCSRCSWSTRGATCGTSTAPACSTNGSC